MVRCIKKMNLCCNLYKRISNHEISCLCTFSYRPQEGKKKKKGKLRKEDISLPTNFQHISHVGWDPNKGFDLENVDPKLKQFFSKAGKSIITYLFTTRFSICIIYQNIVNWNESISRNFWWLFCFFWEIFLGKDYCPNQVFVYFFPGVSERELQDKDTRDFIYDFIDRHGGIEAALEEVENRNRTPAPAPPPRQSSIARPPPPSKVCTQCFFREITRISKKILLSTILYI